MKFWRRLKYYGIGFGIGLAFVFFVFGNRGCSWTPGNRVKESMLSRVLVFSQADLDWIKKNGTTPKDYFNLLKDGDVNFSGSVKRQNPKFYLLSGRSANGKTIYAQFEQRDNDGFVASIKPLPSEKIQDKSTKGIKLIAQLPIDTNLVVFNELAKCQANVLEINPKEIVKALTKNGQVNYDLTNFEKIDKPVYYFTFTIKGKSFSGRAIWYKEKINFIQFDGAEDADCLN